MLDREVNLMFGDELVDLQLVQKKVFWTKMEKDLKFNGGTFVIDYLGKGTITLDYSMSKIHL
jgi:hypothetical protein